ncbi:translation elongation factor 4 [Candidatus Spyradosoma sp. SGI.093]|uniref:translation elongation factor 4 n=1 Tax=Candidatus Spyradosoma sp. SGI.093 TaxID=3420583 RepID=UPI003D07DCB3
MPDLRHIRNFCIIAHVDHGKTTLSDRLLEQTQTVELRQMKDQLLDAMDLEREKGITIKSHPVSMNYTAKNGETYLLNLIDTPGHVDFSYEVSRSLASCEGACLLIDASQGVEAQTVANATLAMQQELEIIPVINKVDLPSAQPEHAKKQVEDVLAIPADDAVLASGKSGIGITEILEAVVNRVPAPRWADYPAPRALIFDSKFDVYKGVISYVRVFSGTFRPGDSIELMATGAKSQIKEVGVFSPKMKPADALEPGMVGYVVTNIRDVTEVKIGDTLTHASAPAKDPVPGFKEVRPMVFSGIYPLDTTDYEKLKAGIAKLAINDAALTYVAESSVALGFGFRCGFLGLLHMEIIQERLRREYDLDIISTYPSVIYKVYSNGGKLSCVDNPTLMPDASEIERMEEPTIRAHIHIPGTSIGDMLSLIQEKRGVCDHIDTIDEQRVMLSCTLPLNEILVDFNDRMKSVTRGYGSMDYELGDYVESRLVKLDILVNGDPVDAFSSIVHESKAESHGRKLCERLKELLPRQLFKVAIQAAVGGKIIARETLGSVGKDVLAKCYGGDITRKRKLLDKQKEGKKRMKQIGKVSIPQDAFIKILKNEG